jgi:hypothetical protein
MSLGTRSPSRVVGLLELLELELAAAFEHAIIKEWRNDSTQRHEVGVVVVGRTSRGGVPRGGEAMLLGRSRTLECNCSTDYRDSYSF